jgi:DnaJ-class molecular chaperone
MANKKFKNHLFSVIISCAFLIIAFGSVSTKKSDSTTTKPSINSENGLKNKDKEVDFYEGFKCSHCGMGRYDENGVCDFCDAVSPSKLEKFNEKHYKSCPACNGTGWRGNEICSICYGKGKYLPF